MSICMSSLGHETGEKSKRQAYLATSSEVQRLR